MLTPSLKSKLRSQARRNKLDADALIEWAEICEAGHAALQTVEAGYLEVHGMDGPEPLFGLTARGRKCVEKMKERE
jgi:selenophosphate synthase